MSPYDTFLGTVPFPLDLALIESMTFATFSKGRMFCLFRWVTRKYCSSDALHPSHYCTFIRSIFSNLICNLCNLDFSTLAQKKIIVFFSDEFWVLYSYISYTSFIQLFKWYCSRGSWSVRHWLHSPGFPAILEFDCLIQCVTWLDRSNRNNFKR